MTNTPTLITDSPYLMAPILRRGHLMVRRRSSICSAVAGSASRMRISLKEEVVCARSLPQPQDFPGCENYTVLVWGVPME
jgi:hypothetical protein